MTKRFFALFTACFWLLLTSTAWADIIWGPDNDNFYDEHNKDCKQMVRFYYANGENGFVSLKESPISDKVVSQFKNGEKIYIGYTYNHNGELWGVASTNTEDYWYGTSGWIPMKQLVLVYDYISFNEEHKGDFYKYKGNFETLKNVKGKIVFWSWPGSGVINNIMDKHTSDDYTMDDYIDYMSEASMSEDEFRFTRVYKDIKGREWLYTNYWIGCRHSWICLSDPSNTEIPAFNPAPQPKLIQPKELPPIKAEGSGNGLVIPVSLVGGVAFVTTILLKLF